MTVSVIMTCYNTDKYVGECLASVLNSTHRDLDVVVVDDGSDDYSADVAQSYANWDSRVRVVQTPHRGRREALVLAHSLAVGSEVCWVDSDDRVAPEAIEACLGALDDEHRLAYTWRNILSEDGQFSLPDHRNFTAYSPLKILVDHMIFHLRMFRADLLEEAGGVGHFESAIDWDMNLRMTEHTEPRCVRRPLYEYRVRPDRMSGTARQKADAIMVVSEALSRRKLDYNLEIENGVWRLRS